MDVEGPKLSGVIMSPESSTDVVSAPLGMVSVDAEDEVGQVESTDWTVMDDYCGLWGTRCEMGERRN